MMEYVKKISRTGVLAALSLLVTAASIEAKSFKRINTEFNDRLNVGTRRLLAVPTLRWYQPCGVGNPSGETRNFTFRPSMDPYYLIFIKGIEIRPKVEALKERYVMERFLFPDFAQSVVNAKIDGIPDVEVTEQTLMFALQHTDSFLVEVYNQLAAIAPFLDKMELDEGNGEFKDDMQVVKRMLYEELCTMFAHIVWTKGLTIPETVTADIIPENIRNLHSVYQSVVDYIILRDYGKLIDYVIATAQHLF